MSMMETIDLTHSFGEKELYRGVDLTLYKGEHMGVVGQNGSGKSTLLKLLLGEILPSGGHITWQQGLRIGSIDQHAHIDGDSALETYLRTAFASLYQAEARLTALYAAMDENTPASRLREASRLQERLETQGFYDIDQRVARVAEGLGLTGIGMARRMRTLSGGQRAKAILAKLLLWEPDVLLLDEPTNFLDVGHITWLSDYLRAFPGSFMIVSHDFDFLSAITNCICDIEFGKVQKYHGSYRDFVRQKEFLREDFARRLGAQQREIARLEDYIARNRVRTATARQAQSRIKKLDKIERLSEHTVLPKPHITFQAVPLHDSTALSAQGLLVGYDGPLLPPLDLRVRGGEKLVVAGFNGIGKSTLMKTLMGQLPSLGGSFAFAPGARVAYFEQDLRWDAPEVTPLQAILAAHPELTPKKARAALSRYGIQAGHALRPIASLSGGEQNRVKLCRMALNPCNFLLLDEPTNHLDAETKEALREAIQAFPGSILLVSHEEAFYQGIADRVLHMEGRPPHAALRPASS